MTWIFTGVSVVGFIFGTLFLIMVVVVAAINVRESTKQRGA